MKQLISATIAKAGLCAIVTFAGCGHPVSGPLNVEDRSRSVAELQEMAASRGDRASWAAQEYAPEMLLAAEYLVEQAAETASEEEARALLARADEHFRGAERVADAVQEVRTLRFPDGRTLGELSVAPWGTTDWDTAGPAQGTVTIEAGKIVYLRASRDFMDADLALLADLGPGAVQYLALSGSRATPEGVVGISGIVGLRDLSLANLDIGDTAVANITAASPALRHVNLFGCDISDVGLKHLRRLPALESLSVEGPRITDRSMYIVSQFSRLKTLIVRNSDITDVGVEYVARNQALERLWLFGSAVTDYSVPALGELENLEELGLLQTSITAAGLRRLEALLPDCNVDTVS